uniref:Chitin-binding type-2 domain-containing protein n=1 Tax=Glossina pallidipes TaxID=7398 RepID=A0A1A9ZQB3_GLOPL
MDKSHWLIPEFPIKSAEISCLVSNISESIVHITHTSYIRFWRGSIRNNMKIYLLLLFTVQSVPTYVQAYARGLKYVPDCTFYKDGALLPDHASCSNYFICVDDKPIKQKCPPGYYFDRSASICDLAIMVKCNDVYYGETSMGHSWFGSYFPHKLIPNIFFGKKYAYDDDSVIDSPSATTTCKPNTPSSTTTCEPSTPSSSTTSCEPTIPGITDPITTPDPSIPSSTTTSCEPTIPGITDPITTPDPSTPSSTTTSCEPTTPGITDPITNPDPSTPSSTTTSCEPSTPSSTTTSCQPSTPSITTDDDSTVGTTTAETTTIEANSNARPLNFYRRSSDCASLTDDTILLDVRHCRRYYVCHRGRARRMRCPLGQWYDSDVRSCRDRRFVSSCAVSRN